MAKVDRGIVDDGSSNLNVVGAVNAGGSVLVGTSLSYTATVLAGSGSVTVSQPGFYYVPASGASGAGYFTGTLPGPGAYPGAQLIVSDTYGGFNWMLTGSAFAATKAVFVMPPGSTASNGRQQGTNLRVSPGGSVALVSDGYYWLMFAGTGSYTLTGLP